MRKPCFAKPLAKRVDPLLDVLDLPVPKRANQDCVRVYVPWLAVLALGVRRAHYATRATPRVLCFR
jgi:hypothetical protein